MSLKDWLPAEPPGPDQQLFGTDRTGKWQRHHFRMTLRQRLGRWLGNKLIRLGARLGGDDW